MYLRVATMYLRLAFWTGAMAYTFVLFARFDLGTGPPPPGVVLTAALFGAIAGLLLAGMFSNRGKRKALLYGTKMRPRELADRR
jgi:membrane associated rhomboid family serine protease